jgi:hypothetical protein
MTDALWKRAQESELLTNTSGLNMAVTVTTLPSQQYPRGVKVDLVIFYCNNKQKQKDYFWLVLPKSRTSWRIRQPGQLCHDLLKT